jgi:transcription-repair coupling factor (superfamily II helicase)
LELQRVRIDLGGAGARLVEVRGGRLSVTPIELEAAQVEAVQERVPEAIYEWRTKTLAVRVVEDPAARLGTARSLAEAVMHAVAEPVAA